MNESLIKKEKKKHNKSRLISNRFSFYSYSDDNKFDSLSFKSKYSYLLNSYDNSQKLIKRKPTKLGKIKKKEKGYNTVTELYKRRFENYFDKYNEFSDVKKKQARSKIQAYKLMIMVMIKIMIIMYGLQKKKKN